MVSDAQLNAKVDSQSGHVSSVQPPDVYQRAIEKTKGSFRSYVLAQNIEERAIVASEWPAGRVRRVATRRERSAGARRCYRGAGPSGFSLTRRRGAHWGRGVGVRG